MQQELTFNWGVTRNGEPLSPLRYSSGATQISVVRDILRAFEEKDLVILQGVMGTGKSLDALLAARELGGGIIVVPTKALSKQYFLDYGSEKGIKIEGVKIGVLTGRSNHPCKLYPKFTANYKELPCTRKLEEKESRYKATEECPYFVYNCGNDLTGETDRFTRCMEYNALEDGRWGVLNIPNEPCSYYRQFIQYANCDVIVMNSYLFLLEQLLGRLPEKPLTCIDEADTFLESLSLRTSFTSHRLERLEKEGAEAKSVLGEYAELENAYYALQSTSGFVENIKSGLVGIFYKQLLRYLAKLDTDYSERYYSRLKRIERYDSAIAHVKFPLVEFFVPEPAVVWQDIHSKINGKLLAMGATCPLEEVLKEVYGIVDYIRVKGETKMSGTVIHHLNGYRPLDVNHHSWQDAHFRKQYYRVLRHLVDMAEKTCFIPCHAKHYVPPEIDIEKESADENVELFKAGKKEVLWSTKIKRGVDFPEARSCIILKYPFPSSVDPLLRAMEIRLGKQKFGNFYANQAYRDFIQQIGRGQRRKEQVLHFYSPDIRCHRMLKGLDWLFNIKEG